MKNLENQDETELSKSPNWRAELFSWIKIIAAAVAIALLLNTFVIANSKIPSGSMENTIMTGDRVIGLRLTYKFREPARGEVAIFRWPDDERIYFVKRVIGLPGETIDIIDGQIYINNSDLPLEEPYLKEDMEADVPMHFEVPADSYLMLGDNRNSSWDARSWTHTYVKKEKLIAKVYFRYFPTIGAIK